ncbi:glycosyltransferase [Desulforamulus aeronauticus]|uniref:Glycosyltransferase involved in cell wall bisynthesis n=1 Tax=Desulforamulus aeronauticus DSM 10349 TaxID=1121421 RepID=A0A1M6TPZ2_9FIRM|nr:glycosyltransferase [Desulforamulus aeronauticus]SHK59051.1 Glycosyltransferase involved in cell wall bisynthesis [Desulforamulus aeronauticus DSM 10349]
MKDTVTLVMIVKNESRDLETCLASVKEQVDEIIIVDTGSTDNTWEIARKYTDKIFTYPWDGNFSSARNYAIGKATGDWLLSLDADEVLLSKPGQLKELISRSTKIDAYMLPLLYPISEETGEYNQFLILRLFRNKKEYRFEGTIHEQVVVHHNEVVDSTTELMIQHNTLSPRERNRKRGRNLAALKKASLLAPQNYFLQYYLGIEWLGLAKPQLALPFLQNAYRQLTDDHLLFRAPALRYLLICLHNLGQLDEMICLSLEAASQYPEYTDVYYLGGIALEEKKEYALAIKWFDQARQGGTPPAMYSHMNGTGSYLALYHMGFCYEKLGLTGPAKDCYERALQENDRYHYPASHLFLLLLKEGSPRTTLAYLQEKGYLNNRRLALTIANLFFMAGYPSLATACLAECSTATEQNDEFLFQLGLYHIYSGRFPGGLHSLKQIPKESNFFPIAQTHQAIALLLTGRFKTCRSLGLQMWKNKSTRITARVILGLTRSLQEGLAADLAATRSEVALINTSLNLLDFCYHYLPDDLDKKSYYHQLVNVLETFLLRTTPGGNQALADYYDGKVNNSRELFAYKFGNGGSKV